MIHFGQKPIHAVIFDMDGTMFDTERLRFETIRQASRELTGTAIAENTLIGSLGLSAKRAEALAKAHNGADYPYHEIRARADALELAHVRRHGVPVKPGLYEVLERLRRSGLSLAVATSSRRAIAEEYLINANVMKYFDITVCGDEVESGKPDPEIFLRAAAELGCAPEVCLIMEDSENGLRAADSSGGLPVYLRDIKDPPEAIRARAFRGYQTAMEGFLEDLREVTPALSVPALTDPFPDTLNDHKVGIHGFGAMGGGYLAQIFSHWDGYTRPSEIIGVTGDAILRDLVNAFGRYTVRYGGRAFDQTIENVHLIDSADEAAVCDMYRAAAIIGLSMPEGAIRHQAPLIAKGLLARHRAGGGALVILTIVNKVSGARFIRDAIETALRRLAPDLCDEIMAKTPVPETVVSRIVSRMSRQALMRQARIKLKIFDELSRPPAAPMASSSDMPAALAQATRRLHRAAETARAVDQLSLVLYHSEPDMPLYAEAGPQMLTRLRQVHTVDDIHMVQMIKNRLWNGTHAIIAWYARLLGHDTIGQGMSDPRVEALVDRLLGTEIQPALLAEFPAAKDLLPRFVDTFVSRCRSSFKDGTTRVGRDPLRKLQRRERVFGNIDMARRHGQPTEALEFGAALGLLYALRMDPPDKECRTIQEVFARNRRIEDVLTYDGPYHGAPYPGLKAGADAALIARIARHFSALQSGDTQHWNWPLHWDAAETDTAAGETAAVAARPGTTAAALEASAA
ncbi:bifunctional mannitol-1-phosphate dehydrogenase/phosphatase [Pseudodonghicola flavimaris]|uniref:HAD-IA family hydrolase n=1 Tax=Pseudodonghicola flavimaris TaxID=3050036 RepID=A0ABT7F1B5_9RHOB|nr:HAD family hydrolase [Pseudodonghicola flavimaris]MDK3018403.1 HAD-IA family hydrolase [Pseudodonghicola flavimaris]